MNIPSAPARRPALKFGILAASSVAISILTGPIEAQVIPAQAVTRAWDGVTTTLGTFNWGDQVNWNADLLPGINEIAAFPAPGATNATNIITIDLGGVPREVGALYLSTATTGTANYLFQNGTLVTNSINQSQDDPNAFTPTALVQSKNGGADMLNVSVTVNTLQLQGQVTSGGIAKYGSGVLRLGTSGTNFDNAINGDITIYGGTLAAAANATTGTNNPLAGSGDIVIGNSGVTLSLAANGSLTTGSEYDFVRNIRAGNNNFTLEVRMAGGTDSGDPNMRAGTLSIGNGTMTVNQFEGFRATLDSVNIAAGATNTRLQINAVTVIEGLTGDAASNIYKRGGTDLEIRGNNEASFAGDVYLAEGATRFVSTGAGINPLGGSDSTVHFANGYGVTALDGGQQLQLRSNAALDFGSNIVFKPGVTIGRIDVNNNGSGSGQTLALGDVNLSGKLLRVTGANQRLGLDNVTVDAGATTNFETSGADAIVSGNLSVGAGSTFNKLGGNILTLSADNSTTILGSINVRAGNLIGTVAGSLGSRPIEVGDPVANSAGFFANSARLQVNHADALANATGTDVTVKIGGIVDINAVPNGDDIFAIEAGGRIQGDAAQLGALNVGTTLLLAPDAIIAHEAPGAATGTVAGLANNAATYYGITNTANTLPNMGAGTPWKGLMGDSAGVRTVQGVDAVTPAILNVEGGNNDPDTIEIYVGGMADQILNLGTTTAGDGAFQWNSVSTQRATLAIRGVVGSSGLGLVPGGRVAFNETAAASGLTTHVDKIVIQQGSLILPIVGAQGGVSIEIQNGGSLDLGNVAGNIIDGAVTVKSAGVFFFNDNQVLGGTGLITFESGSKLDISGAAPATFFTTATNPISFAGADNITVRFAASNITDLDNRIPDVGATYTVSGGATAALLGQSNVSVTTNTQTDGITIDGGTLTNDGTSRGFVGQINLNNSNFTVAATRGTTLALTSPIATTGSMQIGSATAIDSRDKNSNPNRVSGLGLPDPYNGSPQVVFLGSFDVDGDVTATSTHLAFADPNTNIGGDLIFNGNALYLDGGGPLSGGSSTKGGLTARLTDPSGFVANRVADRIILGNYARSEMSISIGTGNQTVTQPFVIEGKVSPVDKRTFFVDRAEGSGAVNVLFTNILLKNGAEFGIDEGNTAVRASLGLEGNATLVRNHDDYDLGNVLRAPGAPASVTLLAGEPALGWDDATETFINGSNATLATIVDGTVGSGVTIDIIRSAMTFERTAVLDGVIRTHTAPARGDALIISRSSGQTSNTTFGGNGEIQLGRSVDATASRDFEMRATEVATGNPAQTHTVAIPVRVLDDGAVNIDSVIRSERHNDLNVTGLTVLNTLNVEGGATVQTVSSNQTRLTIGSVTLGANSGIDSTNSTSVFLGNIAGGTNAIRFSGSAQTRITGNVTAGQISVTGAGIDFDAGVGNTSVVNAPMALSGLLSVRTGGVDLGTNVITGAGPQMVAGLRENKTAGAFDETTANFSNEVKLGPVLAQIAANIGWGENQTATYTGQIFIPDNGTIGDGQGTVAFAKWFDDSIKVVIDGTTILRNSTFNDGVANASANLSEGWHDIEIRLGQGTGGSGPVLQDGNVNNLGLGIDINTPVSTQTGGGVGLIVDGSHYVNPLDNGSMNLFRTTTVKSAINLSPNTSLTAGGFTTIGAVNLGGGVSQLAITGAGASDAESIAIPASSTASILILQPSASVTTGSLAAFSSVTKAGDGTLNVTSGHNLANGTTFEVDNGIVNLQGPGSGGGAVELNDGILNITGSVLGAVTVNSGILAGDGASPTTGAIGGLTDLLGGNIAPNLGGPGRMLLNGGVNFGGAGFGLDLNGTAAGTGYDQLNVTGPVTLASNTPLTISLGFQPAVGSLFTIVLNDGVDAIGGIGLFTYDGTPLAEGDHFYVNPLHEFSISYVGGDGNDAVLSYVVPEPGSAALLLGGLGSMLMVRRRRQA